MEARAFEKVTNFRSHIVINESRGRQLGRGGSAAIRGQACRRPFCPTAAQRAAAVVLPLAFIYLPVLLVPCRMRIQCVSRHFLACRKSSGTGS